MTSIGFIVETHPIRRTESPQGYARNLLAVARPTWRRETLTEARELLERRIDHVNKSMRDELSNLIIEIEKLKEAV